MSYFQKHIEKEFETLGLEFLFIYTTAKYSTGLKSEVHRL